MEMNASQSALWAKLAGFSIDEGDELYSFEQRLARENGWTRSFARRVVDEYRKFVFLCFAAGHPCTPSEEVDEAWHLHIIYTRSYWDRLTPLLPFPLHHNPTKGGRNEDAKHHDLYGKTLESYRRFFGTEPPADIWPPAELRFNHRTAKIDLRKNVVIPRALLRRSMLIGVPSLLALGLALGWTAPTAAIAPATLVVFIGVGVMFLIGIVVAAARQARERALHGNDDRSLHSGTGCGTYGTGCTPGVLAVGGGGGGESSSSDGGSSGGDAGGGCSSGDGGGGGCGSGCGGGGCSS
jgi:hypothetical protein